MPACAPAISAADKAFLAPPLPRGRRPRLEPLGRPLPRPEPLLPVTGLVTLADTAKYIQYII